MTAIMTRPPQTVSLDDQLKQAMRYVVGSVSVITAGMGETRTGLTATSVTSLSVDPPTMLVCVNRTASAWPVIQKYRHFAVNILAPHHADLAARFAGRNGIKGAARYDGADWMVLGSGASGLGDALAVIDCEVEELLERHSHGIVIGAVRTVHVGAGARGCGALVYNHGRFGGIGFA